VHLVGFTMEIYYDSRSYKRKFSYVTSLEEKSKRGEREKKKGVSHGLTFFLP
jgi:hypothetical protein